MKLLTVDTIEDARKKILDCTSHWSGGEFPVLKTEKLDIAKAHSRILAEDVIAKEDIPPFRRSAVDGYALLSADIAAAGESQGVFLKLAGSVEMGKEALISVCSGECAYVPTGAIIPDGADAAVMVEYCETFGNEIAVYESAAEGKNVIRRGEDAKRGDVLLKRGTKILSFETGALAAAGITEANAFVPLRVFIISSGDEIVSPYSTPKAGEIRDINTFSLCALAAESGYQVTGTKVLKDDENALEEAVKGAMKTSDIVILSGGSSQGAKDLTEKVFSRIAKPGVFTHGLAIKPGKPTIIGFDIESDTLLAGLPGHPVSALITFKVLLSWLNMQLTGQKEPFPVPAKISCNLAGSPGRTVYQPVVMRYGSEGYLAEPVFGKAAMISTLTKSNGYTVIDMNKEGIRKGETVPVYHWRN